MHIFSDQKKEDNAGEADNDMECESIPSLSGNEECNGHCLNNLKYELSLWTSIQCEVMKIIPLIHSIASNVLEFLPIFSLFLLSNVFIILYGPYSGVSFYENLYII